MNLVTGSLGGVFSGTGVTANIFDPTGLGGSTISVTYTVGTAPCVANSTLNIQINLDDDASFNYPSTSFCITGTDPIATINGTTGGTYTISPTGTINSTNGTIDLSATGVGAYTITYNTPSGNLCPVSSSVVINIVTSPEAAFSYATPFCQGNTSAALPNFSGNNFPGTFSATPIGLVFISTSTGEIDLVNSTAGTYMVTNNLAASGGCIAAVDSMQIVINPSFIIPETVAICNGNSYTFPDGTTQTNITAQVIYASNLSTALGCDSIIQTTVNINPIFNILDTTAVCSGSSYTFPDGTIQNNITATVNYTSNLLTLNGCDSIIQSTVNVTPQSSIILNSTDTICLGDVLILAATGSGNGTITWYNDFAGTNIIGTGTPFFPLTPTSSGTFIYYVNETGACPSAMDSVIIIVQEVVAQINANPLTGSSPLLVTFGNGSIGATSYFWDFGNGNTDTTFNTTQTYTTPGNYQTILIATNGLCWDTAFVIVEVFDESNILIPNVFTPNGDGSNDVFTVDGINIKSVEGQIYNRWGQKMFSWNNIKGYWDGRTLAGSKAPDGTYFYIIKAEGNDGKKYLKKGGFSLIR